jgi:AcrR family transcriptional regulator
MALTRESRNRAKLRDDALHRLLAAVESLLQEGASFSSITIESLAARAGISRASFYIHFQDKVELLEEWLPQARRDLMEVCSQWYDADPAIDRPTLRTIIASIIREYLTRMTLLLAAHEAAQYDATLRTDFNEAFQQHVQAMARHIRAGQTAGTVTADVQPRDAAEWLIGMLDRVPMGIARDTSAKELERHIEAATHIIWSALYASTRPNRT